MSSSKYCSGCCATASSQRSSWLSAAAIAATSGRPVAIRYSEVCTPKGNTEQVAPTSAPILQMVALPVQEMFSVPGPKYSMIALVPPFTDSRPARRRITSLGEAQPFSEPVRRTPIRRGIRSSQGIPVITSTASAPPTPMASMPMPPALGVWESVPTIMPPGKA